MRSRLIIMLLLVSEIVSAQKKQIVFPPPVFGFSVPEFIDFCKVPEHKKELVYTRFYYSGVEEYWSIYPGNKKCTDVMAELDIPDSVEIRKEFGQLLRNVHEHYWDRYLIIDAVGTYDDSYHRYGHLGTNPANFVVKYLVNVQLIVKEKKKIIKSSSR